MKRSTMLLLFASSIAVILSGCGAAHRIPLHYDASNPLKHIAVLPMKNDTDDVDGPGVVRKRMIEALEKRSYIVKDVKETDQILRDQMGINLGGQLDMTTPQKLGEVLGVEGLLYGTLMDFDETNTGILDVRKVRATFRLLDTATGSAHWERGLGVRSETRMGGRTGKAASLVARGADARDKEVPWVTIESRSSGERNVGQAFAIGLGAKLLTKAVGIHLERETREMVERLSNTLPWGPGSTAVTVPVVAPKMTMPASAVPHAPSFGYVDYGTGDFTAVLVTTSTAKSSNESVRFEIPLARAGNRMRMELDLSTVSKGGEALPVGMSKMISIQQGDKLAGYTLYPGSRKYTVRKQGDSSFQGEKPHIDREKVGSEVIDGHATDKYRVTMIYKNGSTEEGFIWNARDLKDMTIRSEIENKDSRVTTEIKKISLKTPQASLFEVPSDYTEAQNMMEMMNGAQ